MEDTNTPPAGGTGEALSVETAADALADVLDDPSPDTSETEATTNAGKQSKPADRTRTPGPDDGDDGEPEDATDDETHDDESNDGPTRDEAGRFVSPNAKVKLPDGTTTPVSELTKSYLRQSDYTRKAQTLSEERQAFEAERTRASETYQHLQAQFQQVNNWLEATRPQRPSVPYEQDPIAWGQYNQAKEQHEEAARYWSAQARQAEEARRNEQRAYFDKHLRTESEALFKAVPALRDPGKRDAFVTEAAKYLSAYGIKREEIAGLTDHRMILAVRDAVKYHRLQAKKPAVKEAIDKAPPMIRGSKRPAQGNTSEDRANRQRTERLQQTGRFQDGVAALESMKNL